MFDGLKPPRVVRGAPGILTGVELPNKPADAKPTDIEFDTVGDSVSSSRSNVKFRSSKCSSSNALPVEIEKKNIGLHSVNQNMKKKHKLSQF